MNTCEFCRSPAHITALCPDRLDDHDEQVSAATLIDRLKWRQSNPAQWAASRKGFLESVNVFVCMNGHVKRGTRAPQIDCIRCPLGIGKWRYHIKNGRLFDMKNNLVHTAGRSKEAIGVPVSINHQIGRPRGNRR